MESLRRSRTVNWPNTLTVFRTILALIIPWLFLQDSLTLRLLAAGLFVVAVITDIVDGHMARSNNDITTFGKILDPIADKLLVLGSFFTVAYLGVVPYWILIPIALREVTITVLRFYFLGKGVAVAAVKSGKQKTILQAVSLGGAFLVFMHREYMAPEMAPGLANTLGIVYGVIMYALLLTALYQTLYSGFDFFRLNWGLLTGKKGKEAR